MPSTESATPAVGLRSDSFWIEHVVAEELGNSSYVVADPASGQAAVIDPLRDVDVYVERAARRDWRIIMALDTHVHNDFLSGGRELAAGGHGVYRAPSGVDAQSVAAGDEIALGQLRIRALPTPGHTPEHLSYLLLDIAGEALALFSGGALMVGGIARPDLLGPHRTFEQARQALATVRDCLLTLPHRLPVYPTHGAGSFCGASTSGDRETTLERERAGNPLLQQQEFLAFLAEYSNVAEYPAYYEAMAQLNRRGVPLLGIARAPLRQLSLVEFEAKQANGAKVIDVRSSEAFDAAHVPRSLNLGVAGPLSAWVGWQLPRQARIVLVADRPAAAEAAHRQLLRIGMDRVEGWLAIDDWRSAGQACAGIARGTMRDLAESVSAGQVLAVLDVRLEREWVAGHVPGALHVLPQESAAAARRLPRGTRVAVYCSRGYRSGFAASLLAAAGWVDPWHIDGAVEEWEALGHPLTRPG